MGIHSGHRQRLKEEFLQGGMEHFSDLRALELLLTYARPRQDVNPVAHTLFERYSSIAGVLDASIEELSAVPGVGENTAILLKLVPQMGSRYLRAKTSKDVIYRDSRDLEELLVPYFYGATNEMVFLACFDSKLKLLGVRKVNEGAPTATDVGVRQIMTAALSLNASAVVLAHNHPSGLAVPSDEDISTTRYLKGMFRQMSIALLDHVIVADDEMVSMRDSGFFAAM